MQEEVNTLREALQDSIAASERGSSKDDKESRSSLLLSTSTLTYFGTKAKSEGVLGSQKERSVCFKTHFDFAWHSVEEPKHKPVLFETEQLFVLSFSVLFFAGSKACEFSQAAMASSAAWRVAVAGFCVSEDNADQSGKPGVTVGFTGEVHTGVSSPTNRYEATDGATVFL